MKSLGIEGATSEVLNDKKQRLILFNSRWNLILSIKAQSGNCAHGLYLDGQNSSRARSYCLFLALKITIRNPKLSSLPSAFWLLPSAVTVKNSSRIDYNLRQ